jgi:hypothetical protein
MVRCGPAAAVAATRAAASAGCSRNSRRRNTAVDEAPWWYGIDRVSTSPMNPVLDRREPAGESFQLPVAVQQLGVGAGAQVRGEQLVHQRVGAGERTGRPMQYQSLAHTVDFIGRYRRLALSTTPITRETRR